MAALTISERIAAGVGKKAEYRDVDVVIDAHVSTQVAELEEQIDALESDVGRLDEEAARLKPELRFSDPRGRAIEEQKTAIQEQISALEEQRDALRAGTLLTLRFDKMKGDAWASIAAKHPARIDVAIDRISGYDYQRTAREAAPLCGYALGDQEEEGGEPERVDLTPEDWANLYAQMSGRETENIANSLWEMNDWGPRRRIDAARKGSSAGSASRSS